MRSSCGSRAEQVNLHLPARLQRSEWRDEGTMELPEQRDQRRRRRRGDAAVVTHLYFMPVCFPVDSFREMCRGVKEPKLRAMMATVRKRARAWFTMLGLVELCLLCSPLPRFRLWSVQAMDTCMAAPGSVLHQLLTILLRNSLCVRATEKAPEEGGKSVGAERRDGGARPSAWFLR